MPSFTTETLRNDDHRLLFQQKQCGKNGPRGQSGIGFGVLSHSNVAARSGSRAGHCHRAKKCCQPSVLRYLRWNDRAGVRIMTAFLLIEIERKFLVATLRDLHLFDAAAVRQGYLTATEDSV